MRGRKERRSKDDQSASDRSDSNERKWKIQSRDLPKKQKSRSRDRRSTSAESADSSKRQRKKMTEKLDSSGSSSEDETKLESSHKKRETCSSPPVKEKQERKQRMRSSDVSEDSRALEAKKAALVKQLREHQGTPFFSHCNSAEILDGLRFKRLK